MSADNSKWKNYVQELLVKLKSVDLKKFLEERYGAKFTGTNCRCPHPDHEDRNPSFSVWQENGSYYWCCHSCHGIGKSSQKFGNDIIALVRWLSDYEGSSHVYSFREAVDIVSKYCNIEGFEYGEYKDSKTLAANKSAALACHNNLLNQKSSDAYTFLFHRGLDEDDLKKWCIGFNGERITFPLINSFDQVLGFSNRVVGCPDDNKTAKYINSRTDEFFEKRKFLYGINRLVKALGYAYITEGQLDVIMASKYGLRNVLGVLGTAFSEEQAKYLKQCGISKLIFAFDGDDAGQKALKRAAEIAKRYGFVTKFIDMPEGFDLCDLAFRQKDSFIYTMRFREAYYFYKELEDVINEYERTLLEIRSRLMLEAKKVRSGITDMDELGVFDLYLFDRFEMDMQRVEANEHIESNRKAPL